MSYELSTLASEWMWGWGRPCWYKPLFMLKNKSEHKNIINQEPLYQNKVNPFAPRNCKMDYPFKRVTYLFWLLLNFIWLLMWDVVDYCWFKPLYTLQSIYKLLERQVLPYMIAWQRAPLGLEVSGSSASLWLASVADNQLDLYQA